MSTAPDRAGPTGAVQVLERAGTILMTLRSEPQGLSLSQIAERVHLARSTVHRLITALERQHFVTAASPAGGYRLGPALISLGAVASRNVALLARPFLVELSQEVGETVDLAVLEHRHVLFVDQVTPPGQRLRVASFVGALFPAHCTANGKALLAELAEDEIERLLPPQLESLTSHSIGSRAELIRQLVAVRADGVAYDYEEHTEGICAVGTVVATPDGAVAAVTVPVPAQRFHGNERRLVAALLRTRQAIDSALAPP